MLVRSSIREILQTSGHFRILAEAPDGMEAIRAVKIHSPDLLVLDAAMPRTTGVEVIEETQRWSPTTKIAVVTGMTSLDLLQHIVDAGVAGIFLKSEEASGWAEEFRAICAGGQRIDPELLNRLDARLSPQNLSRRERQVLFGIARGESNAMIAERLGISPNTIDKHRTSIMRKFGVHSSTQLVARAFRDGLLGNTDLD
jgi:DNA-binding NarL/FixJ family response regulator